MLDLPCTRLFGGMSGLFGRVFGIGSTFTVQCYLSMFCVGGANATTVTIASVASTAIGITRAFMKKESP